MTASSDTFVVDGKTIMELISDWLKRLLWQQIPTLIEESRTQIQWKNFKPHLIKKNVVIEVKKGTHLMT